MRSNSRDWPGWMRRSLRGAVVDWRVARGGFFNAYRRDGERTLDPARFTWIA